MIEVSKDHGPQVAIPIINMLVDSAKVGSIVLELACLQEQSALSLLHAPSTSLSPAVGMSVRASQYLPCRQSFLAL